MKTKCDECGKPKVRHTVGKKKNGHQDRLCRECGGYQVKKTSK